MIKNSSLVGVVTRKNMGNSLSSLVGVVTNKNMGNFGYLVWAFAKKLMFHDSYFCSAVLIDLILRAVTDKGYEDAGKIQAEAILHVPEIDVHRIGRSRRAGEEGIFNPFSN